MLSTYIINITQPVVAFKVLLNFILPKEATLFLKKIL